MSISQEERSFIDDFGATWDQFAGIPMHGRLLALLYISEQGELTAGDIAEALGVSRGTVSQVTRELIRLRMIQRVSRPGDRRDWFRINPNAWTEASRAQLAQVGPFIDLLRRGARIRSDGPVETRRALANASQFLEDYSETISEFLRTWAPDEPNPNEE